jgi:hypothetical protein
LPLYPKEFIIMGLEDLYYNDEILSDESFHKYSLDPAL